MADVNDIAPVIITLILVSMVLGVGVLVLEKFQVETYDTNTTSNEIITMAGDGSFAVGNVATAQSRALSIAYFNDRNETGVAIWSPGSDVNISRNGTVQGALNVSDATYNISYSYEADSAASLTSSNAVGALLPVSSTWLPLIVTIFVLAIILGLVIRSFAQTR